MVFFCRLRIKKLGIEMITVLFEGAGGSGKSHLLALVGTLLREKGLEVKIQSEQTHNSEALQHTVEQLVDELDGIEIVLKEMRTT